MSMRAVVIGAILASARHTIADLDAGVDKLIANAFMPAFATPQGASQSLVHPGAPGIGTDGALIENLPVSNPEKEFAHLRGENFKPEEFANMPREIFKLEETNTHMKTELQGSQSQTAVTSPLTDAQTMPIDAHWRTMIYGWFGCGMGVVVLLSIIYKFFHKRNQCTQVLSRDSSAISLQQTAAISRPLFASNGELPTSGPVMQVRQMVNRSDGRLSDVAMAAPVRLLSLDCTGTLFNFSASIGTLYHRGFTRGLAPTPGLRTSSPRNLIPSAEEIDARFPSAFKNVWNRWPLFGQAAGVSSFDWWRAVAELTMKDSPLAQDTKAFNIGFREVYNIFQSEEAYTAYEDTVPFLRWARSIEGLQICVVSNITESYRDAVLPALGLDKYIDFGIYSKVAGIEKPDPAIFRLAAAHAGVDVCEVLHIGNDIAKDAIGARDAGCQALFLDRSVGDFSRSDLPADIECITSLDDVRRWIDMDGVRMRSQSGHVDS